MLPGLVYRRKCDRITEVVMNLKVEVESNFTGYSGF